MNRAGCIFVLGLLAGLLIIGLVQGAWERIDYQLMKAQRDQTIARQATVNNVQADTNLKVSQTLNAEASGLDWNRWAEWMGIAVAMWPFWLMGLLLLALGRMK